jgi:hypothetical protein
MSKDNNDADELIPIDPPIIVQGGGSIEITVPNKFKEKGASEKGRHFKDDIVELVSVQINTNTPIALNAGDTITIIYK